MEFVGRPVRKKFGKATYKGKITSYDPEEKWWKITYDDGDWEEVDEEELSKLLVTVKATPKLKQARLSTVVGAPPANRGGRATRGCPAPGATPEGAASDQAPSVGRPASSAAAPESPLSTSLPEDDASEDVAVSPPPAKKPKAGGGAGGANRTSSGAMARQAKAARALKKQTEDVRVGKDSEATFSNFDSELWKPCKDPAPTPLPSSLRVLEVFAGCGGLHLQGSAEYGGGAKVGVETVAAVDIEPEPCRTYRHNYPAVNVMNIGVGRFLATAHRLHNIKNDPPSAPGAGKPRLEVVDVRIDEVVATTYVESDISKASTKARQDKDFVTLSGLRGLSPLHWLDFLVKDAGAPDSRARWEHDSDGDELLAAAHRYLNSDAFGPHKFPLPGDVEVLSGGGWSGYNTTRLTVKDLERLMEDKENRLLGRFLEICWLYRPLYVIMEEVPDVARKSGVMSWMKMAFEEKGYAMEYDARVTTGLYGCPQTRDRLIVMAAVNPLKVPAFPAPLTRRFGDADADATVKAFAESDRCFPLGHFHSTKEGEPMRPLVLGDSISCDLPVEGREVSTRKLSREQVESTTHTYETAPPTPYIEYLRQGGCGEAGDVVHNHVLYQLGASDKFRVDAVPYRPGASWRDMMGPTGQMTYPKVVELTDEEWDEIGPRYITMIPDYMRKYPKNSPQAKRLKRGEMPELAHGWKLETHRFPMIPYWCLTMKKGADHQCYGRLDYASQHDTVHSYHKPHWHVSLVPFSNRVMTVREKARVQGFPDSFVFRGDLGAQYKQIANAVSPQLAKALGREMLSALAAEVDPSRALAAAAPPTWSPSLRNFADFLKARGDAPFPEFSRHKPKPVDPIPMAPMTYDEVLVAYNTLARTDHSHRYSFKTPFQLLDEVEGYHSWPLERLVGIRLRTIKGSDYVEVAGQYVGFDRHEWVDLTQDYKKTVQWGTFMKEHGEEVTRVLQARQRSFCVEGTDCHAEAETITHPDLVEAEDVYESWCGRFERERKAGFFPKPKASHRSRATKDAKDGKREEEAEGEAMEEEVEPEDNPEVLSEGEEEAEEGMVEINNNIEDKEEGIAGGSGGAVGAAVACAKRADDAPAAKRRRAAA